MEWHKFLTISDWAGALKELISRAEKAVLDQNNPEKEEVRQLLRTYIKKSPPVPALDALDDIARKTFNDLFLSITNQAIESISARNAELDKAVNLINGVTEQAEKGRKSIMLEGVISTVEKATEAVASLEELEASLNDPDAGLLDKLKSAKTALIELKEVIE